MKSHEYYSNVLYGRGGKNGKLMVYSTSKNINSQFVIECIDEITTKVKRPTVLVLDNAPWHKATVLLAKQEEWRGKRCLSLFLTNVFTAPQSK